jgi:hypothetical protein
VLLRVNPRGLTGIVYQLYGEVPHRVYLDDINVYHKRNADECHVEASLVEEEYQTPILAFYVEGSDVTSIASRPKGIRSSMALITKWYPRAGH